MMFSKWRFVSGMAFVAVLACAWSVQTRPAASQEQEQQQAPAAEGTEAPSDQAAPAAEPAPDESTAAPAAEPAPEGGATEAPAGDAAAPPADNSGAADVAPVQPEQPAAEAPAAAPAEGGSAISASQVKIGAAVFGADGAKIGEINGIKADDAGHIQEILVTDGVPAGINAKVFEITADKITSVTDGVKLSLSAEEAKKLPIIDNSNG